MKSLLGFRWVLQCLSIDPLSFRNQTNMTRHLSIVGAIIHFLYVSKPFVDEVLRKPAQAKYTSFCIFILYLHFISPHVQTELLGLVLLS